MASRNREGDDEESYLLGNPLAKAKATTTKYNDQDGEGGAHDWKSQDYKKMLPHNPETNGLTYLHNYDLTTANKMMTDPTWTRAIFVRDPKDRFFSAFFDKAKKFPDFLRQKCCASTGDCIETSQTASGFMDLIEA